MAKANQSCDLKDRLYACPECAQSKVRGLEPGDTLVLKAGKYTKPLTLDGLRGTDQQPIVIRGENTLPAGGFNEAKKQPKPDASRDSILTSDIDYKDWRARANKTAKFKQDSGEFPGQYYVADEAVLSLRDCQHVRIYDLYFTKCWPTAVYLDNCQDVEVRSCQFRWGTFAIGAAGTNTRHLLVDRCRWQQYPKNKGRHWKSVSWEQIHGHYNNVGKKGAVSIKNDHRLLDGDFFVGWRISGFVSIRRCIVEDAFNAVHMFANRGDTFASRINRNVVVEECVFRRIRDNAIEPEEGAWNWVVRNNRFVDVYRWWSLQMKRSGWFYFYGNIAWYTDFPGDGQTRSSGTVFKLGKQHQADGPHYFFHNSWHLREAIATKRRFSDFHFFNNAIAYCHVGQGTACSVGRPIFAKKERNLEAGSPFDDENTHLEQETVRFTKAWERLNISFHHNVIEAGPKPEKLREYGYPVGDYSVMAKPAFSGRLTNEAGFKPVSGDTQLVGKAAGFRLKTHFGNGIDVPAGGTIGAWRSDGKRFELPEEFAWAKQRP